MIGMTDIQKTITALRFKHKISANNVVVDDDGVGGGVVDNLNAIGFKNGGKPKDSQYQNLKSECGYKLADYFSDFGFYVDCEVSEKTKDDINQELVQLKTHDSDKDGKLKILPKEKIKENIGRSPDFLDCFIMRMYFEQAVKQKYINKGKRI